MFPQTSMKKTTVSVKPVVVNLFIKRSQNAQPQKELLRSKGFGECHNKHHLEEWIAR